MMPLNNYLGWLKEWNPVQNVWVHFYVLLRKFIQCDCSAASSVKHLNPWLKKGNTLTDVCLLLSLRPCFNNKPLFLLPGCSREKKKERSNKAVRQISGARQQCNSNDRFLMWRERLTGKCLQSKRTPDGMKTVCWTMEVLLNQIEGGFKVAVWSDSSKQQQTTTLSPFICYNIDPAVQIDCYEPAKKLCKHNRRTFNVTSFQAPCTGQEVEGNLAWSETGFFFPPSQNRLKFNFLVLKGVCHFLLSFKIERDFIEKDIQIPINLKKIQAFCFFKCH